MSLYTKQGIIFMNTKIIGSIALGAMMMAGCSTLPTVDKMTSIGKATGYATAFVLDKKVSLDNDKRNEVIAIVNEVQRHIPQTNETFSTVWVPIAKERINADTRFDDNAKEFILTGVEYIVKALDYVVDKYNVRPYQDRVDALVYSFCDTFLANYVSVNPDSTIEEEVVKVSMMAMNPERVEMTNDETYKDVKTYLLGFNKK